MSEPTSIEEVLSGAGPRERRFDYGSGQISASMQNGRQRIGDLMPGEVSVKIDLSGRGVAAPEDVQSDLVGFGLRPRVLSRDPSGEVCTFAVSGTSEEVRATFGRLGLEAVMSDAA